MKIFISYEDIKRQYDLYCSSTNSNMSYERFFEIFKFCCLSLLIADIYRKLKG